MRAKTTEETMMGDAPGRYLSDIMSRESKWNKYDTKTVNKDSINI